MANALLDLLSPDPVQQQREIEALKKIAQLRTQGIPDEQIYQRLADPNFTQAGGYGFLQYITDMSGISSSYNLGRGNIALQAEQQEYNRQGNPYNVVTALQNMRDTGNSAVLSDPTLANVQQGPASIYSDYIKSLFSDDGAQTAATTGQPASMQSPVAASNIPAQQKAAEGSASFFGGNAMPNFSGMNLPAQAPNYDLGSGYMKGPTPNYQQPTAAMSADTGAQAAAAKLVGGTINPTSANTFQSTLASGQIPGFSSLNERDMGLLSPDQRASYMGLVASTGRVSDPQSAYSDYLRKYSMGGSQGSRTVR